MPGQVYLVTDKGERKATGSYYTPDYIVQYIVEHTVGPVLEEAAAPFVSEDGAVGDPGGLARAVLDVNILDPAMGSGHFLVAAVDYVARFLVEKGAEEDGKEGKEGNGESQLAYWRRRVAQACIYGVDLNPLAVELAKLSLWLATVSKNKPLSFLDHHLRCGNSLIGARVADLPLDAAGPTSAQQRKSRKAQAEEAAARAAGQTSMLDDSAFAGSMRTASRFMGDIERLGSETLADVHESERIYVETVRKTTERARRLADLWTAQHFGLAIAADQWPALAKHVLHGGGIVLPGWAEIIEEGQQIAAERRFLHWELEFPEVFFDQHGRLQGDAAGFDAVIGNPPYVRVQRLAHVDVDYLFSYFETCGKKIDVSLAFLELGTVLSGVGGYAGFISSSQWLSTDYGQAAREYMGIGRIYRVVDFGSLPVFDSISTYPAIFIMRSAPVNAIQYAKVERTSQLNLPSIQRLDFIEKPYTALDKDAWILTGMDLRARISTETRSDPISFFGHFYIGALTGLDDAFVVSEQRIQELGIEQGILLPYAYRGEEIGRYKLVGPAASVIYPYHPGEDGGVVLMSQDDFQSNYPRAYAHLQTYKPLLEQRMDSRRLYALEDWYCYLRPGRYDYIRPAKLLIQGVAKEACVGLLGPETAFNGANCPGLILEKQDLSRNFLLAVLNSRLISAYLRQVCPPKLQGYSRFNANNLNQIPVRRITFVTSVDERERLTEKGRRLYGQFCEKWDYASVLGFVEHQLAQEPERADVVHDLLAFLAEQMIALNKQRQKLEKALDPFKFLDRNAPCKPFTQVFAQAIKYGELVDPGAVRHDVEGLRLVPLAGGRVELQAQLKHRDPASGWSSWQYEEDGKSILRSWTPVYRFDLDPAMARFYTHALPVLDQFTHAGKFPGGKTKSTMQKLQAAKLPIFDPAANLAPLEELTAELEAVRTQIDHTDRLIDQVVYRLYGLTEEEIAVVEGRGEPQST